MSNLTCTWKSRDGAGDGDGGGGNGTGCDRGGVGKFVHSALFKKIIIHALEEFNVYVYIKDPRREINVQKKHLGVELNSFSCLASSTTFLLER